MKAPRKAPRKAIVALSLLFSLNASAASLERHAVSLLSFAAGGRIVGCSGTAIARNWVVTAAHCVAPGNNPMEQVSIENAGRSIESRRFFVHPSYQPGYADIALVQLPSALPDSFAPAPLARENPYPGTRVSAYGFAEQHSRGEFFQASFTLSDSGRSDLVSWIQDRSGLGQGDSGGGVFAGGTLVGVFSNMQFCENKICWGRANAMSVAAYRGWIQEIMARYPAR